MIKLKYTLSVIALVVLVFVIGMFLAGHATPEVSHDPHAVPESTARDHAVAALIEFIVAGPGSMEGEMWRHATVGNESLLLYDRYNRPFVYHFPVESDGTDIGGIKVAARKVLGGPIMTYETTSLRSYYAALSEKIPDAIDIAKNKYPGSVVESSVLCNAPSVTGIFVTIKTEEGVEKVLIIDPEKGSVVSERKTKDDDTSVVDHLGKVLSEDEITTRTAGWEKMDQYYSGILAFAQEREIDTQRPLSDRDFSCYADYFETTASLPVISTPAETPGSGEGERDRELEEWQRTADWDLTVAFDVDTTDEEARAVIEEYFPDDVSIKVRTEPRSFWIYLNATNEQFDAYKTDLERYPGVHVCDDDEAFFIEIIENPKTRGNYTLWAIDICPESIEVDENDVFDRFVEDGIPLEAMKIVEIRCSLDKDEREMAAVQLNGDERVLFVMKEYLMG